MADCERPLKRLRGLELGSPTSAPLPEDDIDDPDVLKEILSRLRQELSQLQREHGLIQDEDEISQLYADYSTVDSPVPAQRDFSHTPSAAGGPAAPSPASSHSSTPFPGRAKSTSKATGTPLSRGLRRISLSISRKQRNRPGRSTLSKQQTTVNLSSADATKAQTHDPADAENAVRPSGRKRRRAQIS